MTPFVIQKASYLMSARRIEQDLGLSDLVNASPRSLGPGMRKRTLETQDQQRYNGPCSDKKQCTYYARPSEMEEIKSTGSSQPHLEL